MVAYKTMLFGPIGGQVEIPWPLSGMGAENNLVTETTELLSGELSVYRAPVTYRSYNMSWKGGAMKLQPLLDVHSGVYGRGPYYITDTLAGVQGYNLLPAKWAAPHLLAHTCNGWGTPVVSTQTVTPERRQVTFTGNADDFDEFPNPIVIPTIPGKPLFYKAWGSRTGAASVLVYRYSRSTGTWTQPSGVVRTNRATNPLPGSISGWTTTSGYVRTLETVLGRAAMVATRSATGPSSYIWYGRNTGTLGTVGATPTTPDNLVAVTPGEQLNVSVDLGTDSTNARGLITVRFFSAAGAELVGTSVTSPTTNLVANSWQTVAMTSTVPAGAALTYVEHAVQLISGNTVGGERAWASRVYIGTPQDEYPEPVYFDGSSTATAGTVFAWTGTAHASTSVETLTGKYIPDNSLSAPSLLVSQAEANTNDIAAVKLVPYTPSTDTLTLAHIDLAINDYRTYTPYIYGLDPALYPALTLFPGMLLFPAGPDTGTMFRAGMGTGPVQFTGNIGGKLDSATIDRVGLSIDIAEVSRDPNN